MGKSYVKEKFNEFGAKALSDNELLEMLLSYSQGNDRAGELAKSLIDKFGAIEKVFAAYPNELMAVKGVSEKSAALIRCVSQMVPLLHLECDTKNYTYIDLLYNYYREKLYKNECMLCIIVDKSNKIVCKRTFQKNPNTWDAHCTREIVSTAISKCGIYVLMARCTVIDAPRLSSNDMYFATQMKKVFDLAEIRLAEYAVMRGNEIVTLSSTGLII